MRAHVGGERAPSVPNAPALRRPSRVVAAAPRAPPPRRSETRQSVSSPRVLCRPCSLHLGRRCSAGFHDSSPPTSSPNEAQASRPPTCRRASLHHRHGRAPPNTAINHERPQTQSTGTIVEPLTCRSTGRCSRERWAAIAGVVEVGGDPPPRHTPVPNHHPALPLRRRGWAAARPCHSSRGPTSTRQVHPRGAAAATTRQPPRGGAAPSRPVATHDVPPRSIRESVAREGCRRARRGPFSARNSVLRARESVWRVEVPRRGLSEQTCRLLVSLPYHFLPNRDTVSDANTPSTPR